jgi:imidazolonepropionase-like amidohydrolase
MECNEMRVIPILVLTLLVSACATTQPAPQDKPIKPAISIKRDPFPSTYQPYPSQATLIYNVTILDGKGAQIDQGKLLMADGKIVAMGTTVEAPSHAIVIDGAGKWLTPGIIDSHSHLGVYASPQYGPHSDGNEITNPITTDVWAEHSIWPQDPGFGRALAGGVTSLHILPGSANLAGGRGVTLKNVYARTMQAMKFPNAPYSLKMACGENPKRVYGGKGRAPSTRMGNIAAMRQAWATADEYRRSWDAYEAKLVSGRGGDAPKRDLRWDTLAEVLRGTILVHNHCYRADEMGVMIDMAREFGYKIAAFHHAVESYKIADILKRENICSMMWADWWGFKLEAYDSIRENIPFVHNAGACAVVHSDDEHGIQRLNQEAAKALSDGNRLGLGITKATAWTWLSLNPAKALGIADRTGSLELGKMADVVLWSRDPFSVYARAEKVWIDGAMLYDQSDPQRRPLSDFEVGQPSAGDVK